MARTTTLGYYPKQEVRALMDHDYSSKNLEHEDWQKAYDQVQNLLELNPQITKMAQKLQTAPSMAQMVSDWIEMVPRKVLTAPEIAKMAQSARQNTSKTAPETAKMAQQKTPQMATEPTKMAQQKTQREPQAAKIAPSTAQMVSHWIEMVPRKVLTAPEIAKMAQSARQKTSKMAPETAKMAQQKTPQMVPEMAKMAQSQIDRPPISTSPDLGYSSSPEVSLFPEIEELLKEAENPNILKHELDKEEIRNREISELARKLQEEEFLISGQIWDWNEISEVLMVQDGFDINSGILF